MKEKAKTLLGQVAVGTVGSSNSLGTVAANLTQASSIFTDIFSAIFHIIGITLVVTSIMRYRNHRMNPSETPISKPIFLLLAGIVIGFFPNAMSHMQAMLSVHNV